VCGATKDECYAGLVNIGVVDPKDPPSSLLGDPNASPLAWLGGDMPADGPYPNPAAAAAVRAWLDAGAPND
jgi:hypothetical protein